MASQAPLAGAGRPALYHAALRGICKLDPAMPERCRAEGSRSLSREQRSACLSSSLHGPRPENRTFDAARVECAKRSRSGVARPLERVGLPGEMR